MRYLDFKRFSIYYDPYLIISITLLSILGLFFLYSASDGNASILIKQSIFVFFGLILMVMLSQPDPQIYYSYSGFFLLTSIILVFIAIFFGPEINGANRWISFGFVTLQPSELCKVFLPIFIASYLYGVNLPINLKNTFLTIFLIFIVFFIVSSQPDLGLYVLFLAGLSCTFIGSALAIFIISLPFLWNNFLEPFQRERIATLFNPDLDPFGSAWNITQSKIAIGSGGILGKGFGEGTQSHLYFLPETETDFIFAVIAEEFGLVGLTILMGLYFFIFIRCFYLSINARDRFCRLVIGGLSLVFISTLFINIGMVIGLLPVVGMPLPLISQGGSSLISFYIAFGIIISMASHKKLVPR
jgi:rod shape determining protein RodA